MPLFKNGQKNWKLLLKELEKRDKYRETKVNRNSSKGRWKR